MPTATQVLLEEHKRIREVVQPALEAGRRLSAQGAAALPAARLPLRAMSDLLEGDLAQHAAKEDEILFPAIEAILGDGQGPTVVMRDEHRRIHAAGEAFRRAARGLDFGIAAGGDAAEMAALLEDLGRLISVHFEKEEVVLFPMAESLLSTEELMSLGERLSRYPD